MSQPTEQGATPESTGPVRPGKTIGQAHEFTLILPLKPGGAERTRERLSHRNRAMLERVGTLHTSRVVFFDNDTRMFFASTFDGDWDSYLDDFASKIPEVVDMVFGEAEGYPGIRSPDIKDYVLNHQVEAADFYIAYPDATVRQLRKGQRVLNAWDELLDASEE